MSDMWIIKPAYRVKVRMRGTRPENPDVNPRLPRAGNDSACTKVSNGTRDAAINLVVLFSIAAGYSKRNFFRRGPAQLFSGLPVVIKEAQTMCSLDESYITCRAVRRQC
ncbi:hypothetical protein AXG89_41700 (plasmid) [Burkholderia sp. PAMC 26561]|nr:hypothetical protein AXG89_41700 [Burkholderia sp. PAMC 26561]